jgi:hypothetical protein
VAFLGAFRGKKAWKTAPRLAIFATKTGRYDESDYDNSKKVGMAFGEGCSGKE